MARPAKGNVWQHADGIWRARITLDGSDRRVFLMPSVSTESAAKERAALLAECAKRLRLAGLIRSRSSRELLKELAAAKNTSAHLQIVSELCGGESVTEDTASPKSRVTFAELAEKWTSGELHRDFPDQVKAKRSVETDKLRLAKLTETIGDVPLVDFRLEDAEGAMRALPAGLKSGTRRHYGQIINRILTMAVYPCRLIERNPLPKGFLPRPGKPPVYPYLRPSEDARLLACNAVPIELRMFFGVACREGARASELARLQWSDLHLEKLGAGAIRGSVTLDQNKTDDPRSWALRPDVARALLVWKSRRNAKASDPVFIDDVVSGCIAIDRIAERFRESLVSAKVDRPALHENGENTRRIREHDLRGSFITLALANGRSEAWVSDRTGHTTSQMINRYRRKAREASELELGDWVDLADALPEFRRANGTGGSEFRHGNGMRSSEGARDESGSAGNCANQPDGALSDRFSNPLVAGSNPAGRAKRKGLENKTGSNGPAPKTSRESSDTCRNDAETLGDPVTAALADALGKAAAAGQWSVVTRLAEELEARRKARPDPAPQSADVVTLADRRRR
jgi:integrase